MLKSNELRIGNYLFHNDYVIKSYSIDGFVNILKKIEEYKPIPLTEEWLLKFGFVWSENKSYCNNKQWTLQVTGNRYKEDNSINRDKTWFDGIGDYSWLPNSTKPKTMVVNTLCRGNYACNSVEHVHSLQNLYFALTGKELTIKE